jgi:hypothetical protein
MTGRPTPDCLVHPKLVMSTKPDMTSLHRTCRSASRLPPASVVAGAHRHRLSVRLPLARWLIGRPKSRRWWWCRPESAIRKPTDPRPTPAALVTGLASLRLAAWKYLMSSSGDRNRPNPRQQLYDHMTKSVVPWGERTGFATQTSGGRFIGPFNLVLQSPVIADSFLHFQAVEQETPR